MKAMQTWLCKKCKRIWVLQYAKRNATKVSVKHNCKILFKVHEFKVLVCPKCLFLFANEYSKTIFLVIDKSCYKE